MNDFTPDSWQLANLHPVLIIPDSRLRQKAAPVARVDRDVRRLMDEMMATMYDKSGVGLAATQIGVMQRVIVMDTAEEQKRGDALMLANPELVWQSDELYTHREGCLSIPEMYAEVERPKHVRVRFLDQHDKVREIEAEGSLLSVCLQHEIDHLNGILFIDHLSSLKRNMILRKFGKLQRQKDET